MRHILPFALAAALALPAAATSHKSAPPPLVDAEVRKVDKPAGKVTLKHGAIANLDMPPMTMVFRVKEPGMLEAIKPGDKVRFRADKVDGHYTLIEVKPAR